MTLRLWGCTVGYSCHQSKEVLLFSCHVLPGSHTQVLAVWETDLLSLHFIYCVSLRPSAGVDILICALLLLCAGISSYS